ncbi:hypothetical protein B0H34DRAFT_669643 [Crassisporium funariophilum]|nr:hypothetical protein B0H34DRAFT_669643 [Crassisporium funariophilum]
MLHHNTSKAGSWSPTLYNILKQSPHPLAISVGCLNPTKFRHRPGHIWRHLLTESVYHDLIGTAEQHHPRTLRRIVRVEQTGLSGVLLYELRSSSLKYTNGDYEERIDDPGSLTLTDVFGDLEDPSDLGMELDDLLDAVNAKVVYFPAYACTSFISGQVMNAFLLDQPALRPYPAHGGISIYLPDQSILETERSDVEGFAMDLSYGKLSSSGSYLGDLQESFSLAKDDPHLSLCIRSSTLGVSVLEPNEEEANNTMSTLDSVGPNTPPRACGIGGSSLFDGKLGDMSENSPFLIFGGCSDFSVNDKLSSFLDFSGSFLEEDELATGGHSIL